MPQPLSYFVRQITLRTRPMLQDPDRSMSKILFYVVRPISLYIPTNVSYVVRRRSLYASELVLCYKTDRSIFLRTCPVLLDALAPFAGEIDSI